MKWNEIQKFFNTTELTKDNENNYKTLLSNVLKNIYTYASKNLDEIDFRKFEEEMTELNILEIVKNGDVNKIFEMFNNDLSDINMYVAPLIGNVYQLFPEEKRNVLDVIPDLYKNEIYSMNQDIKYEEDRKNFVNSFEKLVVESETNIGKAKRLELINPKESSEIYFNEATNYCISVYYTNKIKDLMKQQGIENVKISGNTDLIKYLKDPNCTVKIPENFYENEYNNAVKSKNESPIKDAIEKARQKNSDHIDTLNEIESIVMGNSSIFTSKSQQASDPIERASDHFCCKDPVLKLVNENPEYSDLFKFSDNNAVFLYKSNSTKSLELANKTGFNLSDKTKEGMKKLVAEMEKMGIIGEKEVDGEESIKVYAYHKLTSKMAEIRDLIEKDDMERVRIEAVNYQNLTRSYNKIMDLCEEYLGSDGLNAPGNVSTTRNGAIPESINRRVEANAQLNGLFQLVNYAKSKHYDLYDLIDNPQKYMERAMHEHNENFEAKFNDSSLTPGKKLAKMIYDEESTLSYLEGRAFEFIVKAERDPEIVAKNSVYQTMFNDSISQLPNNGTTSNRFFKNQDDELDMLTLRNFMAAGRFYPITEFTPNLYNSRIFRNYEPTFDYGAFVKEDIRPESQIIRELKEQLYEAHKEAINIVDGELVTDEEKDLSSAIIATQLYLTDLVKERKLNLNTVEYAEIREFLVNPFAAFEKMAKDRNEEFDLLFYSNYEETRKKYQTYIDVALTSTKVEMSNYYNSINNKNIDELTSEYNTNYKLTIDIKEVSYLAMIGHKVQSDYDKRTIFGKIFRPSAYRERSLLSKIRSELVIKGLSNDQINDVFTSENKDEAIEKFDKTYSSILRERLERENTVFELNRQNIIKEKIDNIEDSIERTGLEEIKETSAIDEMDTIEFNECVEKITQSIQEEIDCKEKLDFDSVERKNRASYINGKATMQLINTVLNNDNGKTIDENALTLVSDDKKEEYYKNLGVKNVYLLRSCIKDENDPLLEEVGYLQNNYHKFNSSELNTKVIQLYNKIKPEEQKDYDERHNDNYSMAIRDVYNKLAKPSDFINLVNTIKSSHSEEECEKFAINLDSIKPPIDEMEKYEIPYQKENIEYLKENYEELKPILDDCNKILSTAAATEVDYISTYAENVGVASDVTIMEEDYNAIQENAETRDMFKKGRSHINIKKQDPVNETNLSKKCLDDNPQFREETKEQLSSIINDMKEFGIFNEKTYAAEQGTKIYSFARIVEAKQKLEDAIIAKDPKNIMDAYNDYKTLESHFDTIIDKIHNLNDSKFMVSNISSARETSVPNKYRNNFVDGSKLSGLWLYMGMCNAAKVDPTTALNNPIVNLKRIYDKIFNHTNVDKFLKTNDVVTSLQALEEPYSGKLKDIYGLDDRLYAGFERGTKGLIYLADREKDAKLYQDINVFTSVYVNNAVEVRNAYSTFTYDKESLKNLIFVEPEDRTIVDISSSAKNYIDIKNMKPKEAFNREKYISTKHTSVDRIVKRLYEVNNGFKGTPKEKKYVNITKDCANELLAYKNLEINANTKSILDKISKGQLDKVTEKEIKDLDDNIKKDNIIKPKLDIDIPEDPVPFVINKKELDMENEIEVVEEVNEVKIPVKEEIKELK